MKQEPEQSVICAMPIVWIIPTLFQFRSHRITG